MIERKCKDVIQIWTRFSVGIFVIALGMNAETLPFWEVSGPKEIAVYAVFDTAEVTNRLPRFLEFETVGRLASRGVAWAAGHLQRYPKHRKWGICFVEIFSSARFVVNGRSPEGKDTVPMLLWFARVKPKTGPTGSLLHKDYLALDFWVADKEFTDHMNGNGFLVNPADIRFYMEADGKWKGRLQTLNLKISCECKPITASVTHSSGGGQRIFFPHHKSQSEGITVRFAGHRIMPCKNGGRWHFEGSHPLSRIRLLEGSTFQQDYRLKGSKRKGE